MTEVVHEWVRMSASGKKPIIWRCMRCQSFKNCETPEHLAPIRHGPTPGEPILPADTSCATIRTGRLDNQYRRPTTACSSCRVTLGEGHLDNLKCVYGPGTFTMRYCTWCTYAYMLHGSTTTLLPICGCRSETAEYP